MTIAESSDGTWEIRVKRHPEGIYFEEFIDPQVRDELHEWACERYIAAEEGTTYTVEVTLRRGFKFGAYPFVRVDLELTENSESAASITIENPDPKRARLAEDCIVEITQSELLVEEQRVEGPKFMFRGLTVKPEQEKRAFVGEETGTEDIGAFYVSIVHFRMPDDALETESGDEGDQQAKTRHSDRFRSTSVSQPREVDEVNYHKKGITFAVGLAGDIPETAEFVPADYIVEKDDIKNEFVVAYSYRSAAFLERSGIVKYPPPLYAYSWENLDNEERQSALEELQAINMKYVNGQHSGEKDIDQRGKRQATEEQGDRKEWRSWTKLNVKDREAAFDYLKQSNREFELKGAHEDPVIIDDEVPGRDDAVTGDDAVPGDGSVAADEAFPGNDAFPGDDAAPGNNTVAGEEVLAGKAFPTRSTQLEDPILVKQELSPTRVKQSVRSPRSPKEEASKDGPRLKKDPTKCVIVIDSDSDDPSPLPPAKKVKVEKSYGDRIRIKNSPSSSTAPIGMDKKKAKMKLIAAKKEAVQNLLAQLEQEERALDEESDAEERTKEEY